MPLSSGTSRKTVSKNISEFHGGKTYARTAAKFGKRRADAQAIAVALSAARRSRKRAAGGWIDEDNDAAAAQGAAEAAAARVRRSAGPSPDRPPSNLAPVAGALGQEAVRMGTLPFRMVDAAKQSANPYAGGQINDYDPHPSETFGEATGTMAMNMLGSGPAPKNTAGVFVGPYGAKMLRETQNMHPVTRANMPEREARSLTGIKDPELYARAARAHQALRDIESEAILKMRGAVGDTRDQDVWKRSGWYRGEEGALKKEIPDVGAKLEGDPWWRMDDLKPDSPDLAGEFYLKHPAGDFHKIYDIPPIRFDPSMRVGNGHTDPDTRQIVVGGKPWLKKDRERAVSTALHELQHVIQNKEGFSFGSSPTLETAFPQMHTQHFGKDFDIRNARRMLDDLSFLGGVFAPSDLKTHAVQSYKRSAGEVEARNVQNRRAKSYRYQSHPSDTEDVPAGLQILRTKPEVDAQVAKMNKRADGGGVPWYTRQEAFNLRREGMIKSPIPGRTDKIPASVSPGAYVIPADIVSGLGQGNTDAGGQILSQMFSRGPFGMKPAKVGAAARRKTGKLPKGSKINFKAEGGSTDGIPVIVAGGEYIIPPEVVTDLGNGNMDEGHRVLDKFVKHSRKELIKTLKKLPGPVQS